MPQIRRRYYIWLIKAYFKKWKKTIFLSVLIGVLIFGALFMALNLYVRPHLEKQVQKIGYWGMYQTSTIPENILYDVSYGLTETLPSGKIASKAAGLWAVQNDGKVYIFRIKKGQKFHNGSELKAKDVSLNFTDVEKEVVDDYTIKYTLKNPYSPFLTSVSKPIFGKNSNGLGQYKLTNIDLNGGFVRSVTLQDTKDRSKRKDVYFYPTQDALKVAFVMGEVDTIHGIDDPEIFKSQFKDWSHISVKPEIDNQNLVSIFYNTDDSELSNKKARQALNYALPEKFSQGKRAYSPIHPDSEYYYAESETLLGNEEVVKSILESPDVNFDKPIIISTTPEYEHVSKTIQESWKKAGIPSKIQVSRDIPSRFQVLVYKYKVPKDPDQYTLWHSTGVNNISKYKNLRIDKLLEDGRAEQDPEKRLALYSDFQKYLLDDVPASFLYYPYTYTVKRN